jgi:hypothetical protein
MDIFSNGKSTGKNLLKKIFSDNFYIDGTAKFFCCLDQVFNEGPIDNSTSLLPGSTTVRI